MKTVLITGGTRGIGKAIAQEFLQQGYEVILNYCRDEEAALAAQAEFNEQGYCPVLMRADVSDEKQVKDMFKEVFRIYGKVDVLINNAGISLIRVIQDTSAEDWQRVLSVNVGGVFLCSREVTDNMENFELGIAVQKGAGAGCMSMSFRKRRMESGEGR